AIDPEGDPRHFFGEIPQRGAMIAGAADRVEIGDIDDRERGKTEKPAQDARRAAVGRQGRDDRPVAFTVAGPRAHDRTLLEVENWYDGESHLRRGVHCEFACSTMRRASALCKA